MVVVRQKEVSFMCIRADLVGGREQKPRIEMNRRRKHGEGCEKILRYAEMKNSDSLGPASLRGMANASK